MKQIQIINGELREFEVAEKDLVAIPPGTELIFESTLASFAKMANETAVKMVDNLVSEKGLVDKRTKAKVK